MQLKLVLILSFLALIFHDSFSQEAKGSFPNNKFTGYFHKAYDLEDRILFFSLGKNNLRFVFLTKDSLVVEEEILIPKKLKDFNELDLTGSMFSNDTLGLLCKHGLENEWMWLTVDVLGGSYSFKKLSLPDFMSNSDWKRLSSFYVSGHYFRIYVHKTTGELASIKFFQGGLFKENYLKTGNKSLMKTIVGGKGIHKDILRAIGFFALGIDFFPHRELDKITYKGTVDNYVGNVVPHVFIQPSPGEIGLVSVNSETLELMYKSISLSGLDQDYENYGLGYVAGGELPYSCFVITGKGHVKIYGYDFSTEEEVFVKVIENDKAVQEYFGRKKEKSLDVAKIVWVKIKLK